MRARMGLSFAVLLIGSGTSFADVSSDLLFCSKQASPRERISCYDAAARIAANVGPSRIIRSAPTPAALISAPAADTAAPPVYTSAAERNPFQGVYAAIGGSYGFSSPRSVGLSS